jgi:hypothetical protein
VSTALRVGAMTGATVSREPASRGVATTVGTRALSRWWVQIVAAVGFYAAYAQVRDLHGQLSAHAQMALARRHGEAVLHVERLLHLDVELAVQHAALHARPLVVAMNVFYGTFHFLVTCAIFVGLLLFAPAAVFRRARNLLAVVTALALVGFALYPTMPPRLLPARFGYQDTMATVGGLWSYNHGVIEHIADPYAAMPSLHIGWATWCAVSLALVLRRRWQRVLLAAYPAFTAVTVLATGTHWLLDLVAGEALLAVSWLVVVRWERHTSRRVQPGDRSALVAAASSLRGRTRGASTAEVASGGDRGA